MDIYGSKPMDALHLGMDIYGTNKPMNVLHLGMDIYSTKPMNGSKTKLFCRKVANQTCESSRWLLLIDSSGYCASECTVPNVDWHLRYLPAPHKRNIYTVGSCNCREGNISAYDGW